MTRSNRLRILSALLAASAALAPIASAAPVGFVTAIDGIAQVQAPPATSWSPATIDGSISVGDALRTLQNSNLSALLVDDTKLSLGPDTEVLVDRILVGDLATRERSILRETRGQLRAEVGKAFGATTRLEIHTPTAILGVKGSILEVVVDGDRTLAVCVEGSCFARNLNPAITGQVDLGAGLSTVILKGRAPSTPAKPGPDYKPLAPSAPTQVAGEVTDDLLFGEQSAGEELAAATESNQVEQQALNVTNSTAQNVGVEEVFESGGDTVILGEGLDGGNEDSPPPPPPPFHP